jgi:hypothetical protein
MGGTWSKCLKLKTRRQNTVDSIQEKINIETKSTSHRVAEGEKNIGTQTRHTDGGQVNMDLLD